jgi:hypothetical protein
MCLLGDCCGRRLTFWCVREFLNGHYFYAFACKLRYLGTISTDSVFAAIVTTADTTRLAAKSIDVKSALRLFDIPDKAKCDRVVICAFNAPVFWMITS